MKKNIVCAILILVSIFQISMALANEDYAYIQLDRSGSRRTGFPNTNVSLSGNGDCGAVFYLYAEDNASIELQQKKGTCQILSYSKLISGLLGNAEEWGKYEIKVVGITNSSVNIYQWDSTSNNGNKKIKIREQGLYYVYVRPYTNNEISDSYLTDVFLSWIDPPEWWIGTKNNCKVSTEYISDIQDVAQGTLSGASALSREIESQANNNDPVYVHYEYQTISGQYVWGSSESFTPGTHTINPNWHSSDYAITSQSADTVTIKNGVAYPDTIYFYLDPLVYVHYEYQTTSGEHLWGQSEHFGTGTYTVTPQRSFDNYQLVSLSSNSVEVKNGVAYPSSVVLYYEKTNTAVQSAIIFTRYCTETGAVIYDDVQHYTPGSYTIYADALPLTYHGDVYDSVSGTNHYTVYVYEDGTASEGYVIFVCKPSQTNTWTSNSSSNNSSNNSSQNSNQYSSNGKAVYGVAKQKLATRTGPSTKYEGGGTYEVSGQTIKVLSRSYDKVNEIWWVKCEIPDGGITRILWTGYKRFDSSTIPLESIPIDPDY